MDDKNTIFFIIPISLFLLVILVIFIDYLKSFFRKNNYKNYSPNSAVPPSHPIPNSDDKKKVKFVIDGDSVQIWDGNEEHEIRLYGIDCPEYNQEWGITAKAGLIKLIGGRNVYLEKFGVDIYGRVLATVYIENRGELINVNEKMVVKGHAWVMRKFYKDLPRSRQIQLNRLENWARKKRVGLWASDNPCPPWEWRRKKV